MARGRVRRFECRNLPGHSHVRHGGSYRPHGTGFTATLITCACVTRHVRPFNMNHHLSCIRKYGLPQPDRGSASGAGRDPGRASAPRRPAARPVPALESAVRYTRETGTPRCADPCVDVRHVHSLVAPCLPDWCASRRRLCVCPAPRSRAAQVRPQLAGPASARWTVWIDLPLERRATAGKGRSTCVWGQRAPLGACPRAVRVVVADRSC